jgi:glycopeptide antibiotics resistance protein
MEKRDVNLIPFFSKGKIDLSEIILNIIIFVPAGIYAGVLFKRRSFVKKLFFFFLVSLVFEALQFVLRIGAFDVTDIITNTIGGITGVIIFKAIEKLFNNSSKAQKFINIIAVIATVLMILLLILLKMNMLPVRYQ